MPENSNSQIKANKASLKAVQGRCELAFKDNAGHNALVEEVYKYCLPMRRPADEGNQAGQRFNHIFDGTGPKAAFRFAGRLQSDFTPPFQKFFELKSGPLIAEGDGKKATDEDLAMVSNIIVSQLNGSNFDVESHSGYLDLFAGQMAILMLETGDKNRPTAYVAVPSVEVAISLDGFGRVVGVYWKRKFRLGDLPFMWKDFKSDSKLKKKIEKEADAMVEVCQATEYDAKSKEYQFKVYLTEGCEYFLHESKSPYTNWLTPAFYKVPGEAKGRGVGMNALGPIKVANKLQEFGLKNSAFSMLGIWTYRDDGVFRTDQSPIMPGAFWKVQSNGGPFGPSIQRQPMDSNYDLSMFVLNEIQAQIKMATFDDTLPADTAAVRSATEIMERMKRLAQDWAGAYSRLQREFLRPLIEWNIWVASKNGLLPGTFNVDEMLIKLEIISPIARGDQANAVENEVKWVELLKMLFGEEVMMLTAKIEDIGVDWGKMLGVPEKRMRSNTDRANMQKMIAQYIAMQQMAAQAQQGGEAPA